MKKPLLTSLVMVAFVAMAATTSACADRADGALPRNPASQGERRVLSDDDAMGVGTIGTSTTPPIRRAPPEFDDADPTSVRLFHDVLAPYGTWTDDPRLGLVWIPSRDSIGESFVPYATNGRWSYREVNARTNDGRNGSEPFHEYVWVSELAWGWVTFHYGRWAYTGDRGWAWVSGRRYSGAWVDWRSPAKNGSDAIIGWGPTPPSNVWRVAPAAGEIDPREARLFAVPFAAFATPYSYARAHDLFAPNLGAKLLAANAALAVAYTTQPSTAPSLAMLGLHRNEVPAPPAMDRGLQQAWMLATPASAGAVGAGPELGPPPHLRTWVVGGPRYATVIH